MNKTGIAILLGFIVFCGLSPLYGAEPPRSPIDINLIIDGSAALANTKEEITAWVFKRFDQMFVEGDRVTVWNAGGTARIVYNNRINNEADREAFRKSIQDISAAGSSADLSGALREAAARESSGLCYTLLISASPMALSSLLSGPQANLLRFSRVEEFSGWRALVIGLNLDTRVRNAAAEFFGS